MDSINEVALDMGVSLEFDDTLAISSGFLG